MAADIAYRRRRPTQLVLILFGQMIGFSGFLLTGLNQNDSFPPAWPLVATLWFGVGLLAHVVASVTVPYADPLLLPIVFALTGLGLAQIHRIDLITTTTAASTQMLSVAIGVVCLCLIAIFLKDPRKLKGFPNLLSLAGMVLLLLPLVPGLGVSVYGSQIWIRVFGFSFQPAELAKIVLAASFAAYLTEKREVLSLAGRKVLGVEFPRMRDMGPIAITWIVSLAIMVFENDLGTSLLFFGLFIIMLYVSTGKASWALIGLALFVVGGALVFMFVGHARRRIDFWLHPFDYPDTATQIIQAQFGLSHGGLLGSGWGLGRPGLTIFASSDMISVALGEEIGITGLMGIIVLYGLFVFRGLKTAVSATDTFVKLFATGLSFAFLLQTFAIIGGATRLLPLTGLVTPFLSAGGSSMIANWILVGLLLSISHQTRRPSADLGPVSSSGATGLDEEMTQVISAKELAKIGVGEVHPVQELHVRQVRLTPDEGSDASAEDSLPDSGTSSPDTDESGELTTVITLDQPRNSEPEGGDGQ